MAQKEMRFSHLGSLLEEISLHLRIDIELPRTSVSQLSEPILVK
eukprot:COSAG06_NODE_1521_length_9206_cov_45.018667_7_plen_44_part_00